MSIFFKISKYASKLFILLLASLLLAAILFLYKPSYFLNNIENYLSTSLESYLLDIDVSIDNIYGNFFSGFNIDNIKVLDKGVLSLSIQNINIQPNLKEILYGNIIFKTVKVKVLDINDVSNISLNNKFISNSSLFMPNIIIEKINVESGIVKYDNLELLFSGYFNASFQKKNSIFNIENLNFVINDSAYFLNNGLIIIKNENVTFEDFSILNNSGLIGKLNTNFNLFPFNINHSSLSLNGVKLPIYNDMYISDVRFTANRNHILDYSVNINLETPNRKEYLDITGDYDRGLISLNFKNQKFSNNTFSAKGTYNIYENIGNLSIDSNSNNDVVINGDLDFEIYKNLNIVSDIRIDKFSYQKLNFDKILGRLSYNGREIKLFETRLINSDNIEFNINNGLFSSLNQLSLSGSINGQKINLNLLNDWFGSDFINYISKGTNVNYEYHKDNSVSNLFVEGNSKEIIINQAHFKNVEYEFSYSNKLDKCFAFAKSLVFNNHSLDSISFNYMDGIADLHSKNINSGQFLRFSSKISDSNVFIDRIDARINNVDIYGEKISLINIEGNYISDNINLLIDGSKLSASVNFKNSSNINGAISMNNLDFANVDKLLFLNNRYNGYLTGNIDFSVENSLWYISTDLLVDNFKFDELEYSKLFFIGRIQKNKLMIDQLLGQDSSSSFELSGFLNLNNRLHLSEYCDVNLKGNIQKFDIYKLNRYIPWTIDIGGKVSSDIFVSGKLNNIKFDLNPIIINPQFDKIDGVKASGKISYKNNRIYLSNATYETVSGKYDINGSLPVNLNYFNIEEIDSKPIYIDIVGRSKSLELLMPYFPFINEVKGDFDYTLNIYGNYNNTIRDGQITIKDADMKILQLDNRINNINAYAVINNNRLVINNFEADLSKSAGDQDLIDGLAFSVKDVFDYNDKESNSINLLGSINLESFFSPDLSLNVVGRNNYLSSSYGQFEGAGDSELSITGRDTLLISGEFRPRFNEFIVFDIENRENNNEIEEVTDSKFVAYDIYIPFPNGIRIKSDNINLLLEGEMNLSSFSNEDIAISGKANIVDGYFFYNGNEFYNTQGTILIDPISSSPYIEVHSETDVYEDNISVSFIGYTDNPNLILESSVSNYSQSDILQLLTFKDKNLDNSITQPFGNVITNYLESQLEKNVTLYTDLDEFRLQRSGSLINGFGDAEISVFMGKRISNRLYLNTKINLNDNSFNEYEMSYRLNSNSSIVAKIDDNRYWKLNYRFKYKY